MAWGSEDEGGRCATVQSAARVWLGTGRASADDASWEGAALQSAAQGMGGRWAAGLP